MFLERFLLLVNQKENVYLWPTALVWSESLKKKFSTLTFKRHVLLYIITHTVQKKMLLTILKAVNGSDSVYSHGFPSV